MTGLSWRLFLLFSLFSVVLASSSSSEQDDLSDLRTEKSTEESHEGGASKTGAHYESEEEIELYAEKGPSLDNSQLFAGRPYQLPEPGDTYLSSPIVDLGTAQANAKFHADVDQLLSGQAVSGKSGYPGYPYPTPSKNVYKDGVARPVSYRDYIYLDTIPGMESAIRCQREGELYNFWSSRFSCLVCACVKEFGSVRPVCASCEGCREQPPPSPYVPDIIPDIVPDIVPVKPIPPPEPEVIEKVTCKPLPSGTPFQNPLHPCQICICRETLNFIGEVDVNIVCHDNPQCVVPPDNPPLPYIPDETPIPLPECEKFPHNVLFPHPIETCQVCKCTIRTTTIGIRKEHITCTQNPDCPGPEYTTLPPYPVPDPFVPLPSPVPFPDIVNPDGPWPPVVPPAPVGPLPGPSPHESCRPYVPNQPFQHPWDECQMCVCTEATAVGRITIEVNCATKKSCCIEPNDLIPSSNMPIIEPSGKLKIVDQICEFKSFGAEFVHPGDPCQVCTCEIQGHAISASCQLSPNSECGMTPYPIITQDTETLVPYHGGISYSTISPYSNYPYRQIGISGGISGGGSASLDLKRNKYYNQYSVSELETNPYLYKPSSNYLNYNIPDVTQFQVKNNQQQNWYHQRPDLKRPLSIGVEVPGSIKMGVKEKTLKESFSIGASGSAGFKNVPSYYQGYQGISGGGFIEGGLGIYAQGGPTVEGSKLRIRTKSGHPEEQEPAGETR